MTCACQPGALSRSAADPLAVGVVVPVRNEEDHLMAALDALVDSRPTAGRYLVSVVLDGCTDRSAQLACDFAALHRDGPVEVVVRTASQGSVGAARATGVQALLDRLDALPSRRVWLATTDADSAVPCCWIGHQLLRHRDGVEAWTGPISIDDWTGRRAGLAADFDDAYRSGADRHVHGTSMGFTADAYLRSGGFRPVATAEDHTLWHALGAAGAQRLYDVSCPVVTSSRRVGRAPHGFAGYLGGLEASGS